MLMNCIYKFDYCAGGFWVACPDDMIFDKGYWNNGLDK